MFKGPDQKDPLPLNSTPGKRLMSAPIGRMIAFACVLFLPVCQGSERVSAATSQAEAAKPAGRDSTTDWAESETPASHELDPIRINAPLFKIPRTPFEKMKLDLHFALKLDFGAPAIGGAFVITPGRLRQSGKNVAATVRVLDGNDLSVSPASSLARALTTEPAYGADRRSHQASPGPFAHGIALRGAHALVLRDGVPLNDPFGGWVPWADVPQTGLARVEIVPSGGATAWGGGALGGTVQFLTLPARGKIVMESYDPQDGGPPETKQVIRSTGQTVARFGQFGTADVELVTSQPAGHGVLQLLGRAFRTDGYSPVAAAQRGPVDQSAGSRHHRLEARWRQSLGKDRELVASIRTYDESGGNGTPYQRGSSHGTLASVAIASNRTRGFFWNALAYAQSGSSANRFSAVSADRSEETPVMDRFAVPTDAFGASWTGAWRHSGDSRTNAGVDLKHIRGETQEAFLFTNGVFTRQLSAGGEQSTLGAFAFHDRVIVKNLRATAGARIDLWRDYDGYRRETDLATRSVLLDQRFVRTTGTGFNPSLGIVWQPRKNWRFRVHSQHAFRLPTLGERHQSSGRYSVVTAANPALRTEHSTDIEFAAGYSVFQKASVPVLSLEARVFRKELGDTVGTIAVARGSGALPLLDSLPPGYRGERRVNLDRARLQGLELATTWQPSPRFQLEAVLRLSDSQVLHATVAPGLGGKRLADTPHDTAAFSAKWLVAQDTSVRLRVQSTGHRFADSENTLALRAATTVDLGFNHRINERTELFLTAENLTDSRVETERDASGLVYLDSPRVILAGLRLTW